MAQGRSIEIISMIEWIRTSRLSKKNSLSWMQANHATDPLSETPASRRDSRDVLGCQALTKFT